MYRDLRQHLITYAWAQGLVRSALTRFGFLCFLLVGDKLMMAHFTISCSKCAAYCPSNGKWQTQMVTNDGTCQPTKWCAILCSIEVHKTYGGWKKCCTSWWGVFPIIFRVSTIQGGAGFLPSTVSQNIVCNMEHLLWYLWTFEELSILFYITCLNISRTKETISMNWGPWARRVPGAYPRLAELKRVSWRLCHLAWPSLLGW